MRLLDRTATGVAVAGAALAIAACGGASSSSSNAHSAAASGSKTVDIYSSLPLHGALSSETIPLANGIKLALAEDHGRAGSYAVVYQSLDDAAPGGSEWDPTQTEANAREAATDPKAVYYIGEFTSGASEISIPILNQAGVPQVSPAPGEPKAYYPTAVRTFLQIVPNDSVQAAADLLALKQAACTRVALAHDKEAYGAGLAKLLELEKGQYGVNIISDTQIDPMASNFHSYAATIKTQGADCFELAGIVSSGAVQITEDVSAALPDATILGPDRMCVSSWTNANDGGVTPSIDSKLRCTLPTLALGAYPGGKAFLAAYKAAYGVSDPDPYAIYGYEAMKLGLDTIASLGANGANRADVLKALFAIRDRDSALGTYGFDASGETTLASYGLYKVGADGDPVFDKTLTLTKTL